MRLLYKIIFGILILVCVTAIAINFQQPWLLVLYNTVLALFPSEIKKIFNKIPNAKRIRISCSYIFKIETSGHYLLVKDEQGRNNFHPVGGVYKYDPNSIDIAEHFEGEYDGLFDDRSDTRYDLRITIDRKKLRKFKKWFYTEKQRENTNDLSREFKEELIDRNILPEDVFEHIKYKYIGSHTQKSFNQELRLKQIRHFDIFSLKLTNAQRTCLENMKSEYSEQFIFVTKDNISRGYMHFAGKRYEIAEYTNLILTGTTKKIAKEFADDIEYTAVIEREKVKN